MQVFKSPVNKQSYKPPASDLSWDWHSEADCNCGPWWGRGEAGDLDLGMHWWLVRNNCVQQEIWKRFLYVAPIFRCVAGNHSQNFVFLDFEGLDHSGNGWLICSYENTGCDLGWLAFGETFDLWSPGSPSITLCCILQYVFVEIACRSAFQFWSVLWATSSHELSLLPLWSEHYCKGQHGLLFSLLEAVEVGNCTSTASRWGSWLGLWLLPARGGAMWSLSYPLIYLHFAFNSKM